MHPTIVEIDVKQFVVNLQAIRQQVGPKVKICLPVKANAYGHGLLGIAKEANQYVDYFGVACVDEGVLLRDNNITKPILVFGAFDQEQVPELIANNLEITVSSLYKAKLLAEYCKQHDVKCFVHIKVDTGMNRIGTRPENIQKLVDYVFLHTHLVLVGIYSHFACSDDLASEFTQIQLQRFNDVISYAKTKKDGLLCHIANSGGVCYFPESYFDMVRPGIMSYGYIPATEITQGPLSQIKPILSLKSRVGFLKVVAKGVGISYNHTYITDKQTTIITIPIGYGDGYPRMLSNIGEVLHKGIRYKVSGNVCMDMLMVDVGSEAEVDVGDEVVLIGKQNNQEILAIDVAIKCNTIVYEVCCRFNDRLPRKYII